MKRAILFLCFTMMTIAGSVSAQVSKTSSLYIQLQKMDSILFEQGFNKCNVPALENMLTSDFEFYHDQNGLQTKDVFVKGFKESICENPKGKPIRKLVKGTLVVYPLSNEGKIYGAIQMGDHDFYMSEPGKPLRFTSTAKFVATWILVNDEWKLKRELSYDHSEKKK